MYYMKQAASRKKAVSPLPRKSHDQPKAAVKKTVAATQSRQPLTVKAVKSAITVKSAPVVPAPKAKSPTAVKQQKIAAKTDLAATANKKATADVSKIKPIAAKSNLKKTIPKIAPKMLGKVVKTTAAKTELNVADEKNRTAKVSATTKLKVAAAQAAKQQTPKTASKVSAVKVGEPTVQSKPKTPKIQASKQQVSAVKTSGTKTEKITGVGKTVNKNKKSLLVSPAANTSVAAASKSKMPVKSKNDAVHQASNIQTATIIEKKNRKPLKITAPTVAAKVARTPRKIQPTVVQNAAQPKANRVKLSGTPTIAAPATAKIRIKKVKAAALLETAPPKKSKAVAPPIETVETIAVSIPKPKKKKVKPIGAAIFRGIKERYDFQVFPVDGEFEDAAAIYIISRRLVDKNKRAHHRMVCIGQADSVLSELKKHRKGKCFKQHQANAISVLREENEQKRLKITLDLMSAHAIPCPHV